MSLSIISDQEAPGTPSEPRRSGQKRKAAALAVVVVLAAVVGYAVMKATQSGAAGGANAPGSGVLTTSSLVGQSAPSFKLPSLANSSQSVALGQLLGKPVVINFFSPACVPCHQEMPTFAALGAKYAGKINFIGVAETSGASAALQMVHADHVPYPTVLDANGDLVGPYLIPGVPVTVFVSAKGVVKGYVAGAISDKTLTQRVTALLSS